MAGLYSRFRQAGYTTPKYLLEVNKKNILGEIMQGLTLKYNFEIILLIANKNDYEYESKILNTLETFKKQNLKIKFINSTLGQAETASIGVNALKKYSPKSKKVVFHNIDTILYDRDFKFIDDDRRNLSRDTKIQDLNQKATNQKNRTDESLKRRLLDLNDFSLTY